MNSSDLKNLANFKSFSRSLEFFFLTVGQNNFGNKIPYFFLTYLHTPWTGVDIIDSVHMYMFLEGMDLLERLVAYWAIIRKHLCCMDLEIKNLVTTLIFVSTLGILTLF